MILSFKEIIVKLIVKCLWNVKNFFEISTFLTMWFYLTKLYVVDPPRIELGSEQCECSVLPLNYEPLTSFGVNPHIKHILGVYTE